MVLSRLGNSYILYLKSGRLEVGEWGELPVGESGPKAKWCSLGEQGTASPAKSN